MRELVDIPGPQEPTLTLEEVLSKPGKTNLVFLLKGRTPNVETPPQGEGETTSEWRLRVREALASSQTEFVRDTKRILDSHGVRILSLSPLSGSFVCQGTVGILKKVLETIPPEGISISHLVLEGA
jgi:hypothetical protein